MSSNQDFFQAAKHGLDRQLETILIQRQIPVDSKDPDASAQGKTALHWAASSGNRAAVEVLLNYGPKDGALVNSRDNGGNTPLITAAMAGATEVVRKLLSIADVEVDAENSAERTALMEAARRGDYETTKLILKSKKVDINRQDEWGDTALLLAVRASRPSPQTAFLLLQYGARRALKNTFGDTAQKFGGPRPLTTSDSGRDVFGEFPKDNDDATLGEAVRRAASRFEQDAANFVFMNLRLTVVDGLAHSQGARALDFSFLPKDIFLGGADVDFFLQTAKQMTNSQDEQKPCIWIHVPSNNVRYSSRNCQAVHLVLTILRSYGSG
jgi:ankyrin repeat protein